MLPRERKHKKRPPQGGLFRTEKRGYFLTASTAAEAAALAAATAEFAAEAAMFAAPTAEAAVSEAGGVTTTVAGAGAGAGAGVAAGAAGVTVVVSSFLLQAANEIAAIIETNNNAFFILVPLATRPTLPVIEGTLLVQSPSD